MNSISIIEHKKAWDLINQGARLIDVRTAGEFNEGHIAGAINISHDQIARKIGELQLDTQDSIVLYCKSGGRSDFAMKVMQQMGFAKAVNAGGYEDLLKS